MNSANVYKIVWYVFLTAHVFFVILLIILHLIINVNRKTNLIPQCHKTAQLIIVYIVLNNMWGKTIKLNFVKFAHLDSNNQKICSHVSHKIVWLQIVKFACLHQIYQITYACYVSKDISWIHIFNVWNIPQPYKLSHVMFTIAFTAMMITSVPLVWMSGCHWMVFAKLINSVMHKIVKHAQQAWIAQNVTLIIL